jgi:hypothetical protein
VAFSFILLWAYGFQFSAVLACSCLPLDALCLVACPLKPWTLAPKLQRRSAKVGLFALLYVNILLAENPLFVFIFARINLQI